MGQEIGEDETKALGGVLEAGPAGGGEEFGGGGLKVAEVGDVTAGTLVGGGVKFEVNLVVATNKADGEGGTVGAMDEAVFDADGEAETKKGIIGRAGVEPIGGQVELGADGIGGFADGGGDRLRLEETAGFEAGEHIDIAGGGATDEAEGQQGGAAADDEMIGRVAARGENLTEKGERTIKGVAAEAVHLGS